MGRRYRIYFDSRKGKNWIDLKIGESDLQALLRSGYDRWHYGSFLDIQSLYEFHHYHFVEELFVGNNPVFQFNKGLPDDISAKLKRRITNYAYSEIWWYEVKELLIGDWDKTFVFVSRSVPTQYVDGFGDGSHHYTRKSLGHVCHERIGKDDRVGEIVPDGVNYYANPKNLYRKNYDNQLEITWKMTLSEFFPFGFMILMKHIQNLNKTRKMRIYLVYED